MYQLDLMLRGALFDVMEHTPRSVSQIAINQDATASSTPPFSHVRGGLRLILRVQGRPLHVPTSVDVAAAVVAGLGMPARRTFHRLAKALNLTLASEAMPSALRVMLSWAWWPRPCGRRQHRDSFTRTRIVAVAQTMDLIEGTNPELTWQRHRAHVQLQACPVAPPPIRASRRKGPTAHPVALG